ncbi:MAG: site-2 protease family protein [Anaerolineaceae bacterium]|nr:site-2 protease family protein [Anaerolineaceae bacterium]
MFGFLNLEPAILISRVITLMIAFTIHELSHALTAYWLGDTTAKDAGRITLNPIAHIDPMGALMLMTVGFGWAKATPINPYLLKRRTPAGVFLVSLAGPLSNILLAGIAAIFLNLNPQLIDQPSSGFLPSLGSFLTYFFLINLTLAVFNLFPIAPLDGDKILDFLIPPTWRESFERLRPYGSYLLLIFAFVLPMMGISAFSSLLNQPINTLVRLLLHF